MNRRNFLRGITVGGALLAAPTLGGLERAFAQETGTRTRPNIVLFSPTIEDGAMWLRTPNLDRMAKQGAICPVPN